jgi:hypothetical protein
MKNLITELLSLKRELNECINCCDVPFGITKPLSARLNIVERQINKIIHQQALKIPNIHHYKYSLEKMTLEVYFDNIHSKKFELKEDLSLGKELKA